MDFAKKIWNNLHSLDSEKSNLIQKIFFCMKQICTGTLLYKPKKSFFDPNKVLDCFFL